MEPDGPATTTSPMTRRQAARAKHGWSQTQAVARLRHAAASAGISVPDHPSLKTQLSRWERGAVRKVSSPYRMLLRTVYGLTDEELGLLPADPPIFARARPMDTPRMTPEVSAYYESLFAEHVRADNLIGPRPVLDVVSHQAETLGTVARQARDAERAQAVRLTSRYEELLG